MRRWHQDGRVKAILAKSVAHLFRNAINLGLPVLVCNTDDIANGDQWKSSSKPVLSETRLTANSSFW